MLRNFKVMLAVLVVLVLAGGAYAFAAYNYVPDQTAGDGAGRITGVDISDIEYTMDPFGFPGDESWIEQVSFTVTPQNGGAQPDGVEIQLRSFMPEWFPCDKQTSSTTWTCELWGVTAMAE